MYISSSLCCCQYRIDVMKLLQMSILRFDVKLEWQKESTVCAMVSTDGNEPSEEAVVDPRFTHFKVYRMLLP